MTSFDEDLAFFAEAVESEKHGKSILPSSVILLTFRGMLRIQGSNIILRQLCADYIYRVSTRTERKGPEHGAWCDVIVKGLVSALEGQFFPVNIPVLKMQAAINYPGPLKKYYESEFSF